MSSVKRDSRLGLSPWKNQRGTSGVPTVRVLISYSRMSPTSALGTSNTALRASLYTATIGSRCAWYAMLSGNKSVTLPSAPYDRAATRTSDVRPLSPTLTRAEPRPEGLRILRRIRVENVWPAAGSRSSSKRSSPTSSSSTTAAPGYFCAVTVGAGCAGPASVSVRGAAPISASATSKIGGATTDRDTIAALYRTSAPTCSGGRRIRRVWRGVFHG